MRQPIQREININYRVIPAFKDRIDREIEKIRKAGKNMTQKEFVLGPVAKRMKWKGPY